MSWVYWLAGGLATYFIVSVIVALVIGPILHDRSEDYPELHLVPNEED